MRNRTIALTSLILLSCFIFSSCSSKLSRSKAKDLIIKEYGFPKPATANLDYGILVNGDYMVEKFLADKGLLTRTEVGTTEIMGGMNGVKIEVKLTPAGEKYKVGAGQNQSYPNTPVYYMKCADMTFVDITGIQEESETSASVSYTWKYENATPFGEAFAIENKQNQNGFPIYTDGGPHTEQVSFKKFDDGWRISN